MKYVYVYVCIYIYIYIYICLHTQTYIQSYLLNLKHISLNLGEIGRAFHREAARMDGDLQALRLCHFADPNSTGWHEPVMSPHSLS